MLIHGEVLLVGVAIASFLVLVTIVMAKHQVLGGKRVDEQEIERHLARRWLANDDRKMLERRLAALRASRPVEPTAAPLSPPIAKPSRGEPAGVVKIERRPGGGFYANCSVGGVNFEAHWDTGADVCRINHAVARQLGIRNPARELSHDLDVISNGYATKAAKKKIDWTVAGITIPDVDTVINHTEGKNASNLIGMPFISRLGGTKIVGETLYIYPPR